MKQASFLWVLYVIVGLLTLIFGITSFAQDSNPTPRPTKTPSPTAIEETATATVPASPTQSSNVTSTNENEIDEPFIQQDLAILSGNVQRPNGLFWHNGKVYASCNGDWTIYEIDADTGATITYIWGVRNAHTLYAEDDDSGSLSLWIPDFQTNSLVRIFQRSTQTIVSDLNGPWGITPLNNDFLVTNLLGNNLMRISRAGESQIVVEGFRSPAGVAVNGDYIYVANNGSSRRAIEWITVPDLPEGSAIDSTDDQKVQPLVSGLQNTTGLHMGHDGYLYFAYSLGTRGVIGRVQPEECHVNGGCSNDQVEIVVYTDLAAPLAGMVLSPDNRLYMHSIFSPDIYYVSLDDTSVETAQR